MYIDLPVTIKIWPLIVGSTYNNLLSPSMSRLNSVDFCYYFYLICNRSSRSALVALFIPMEIPIFLFLNLKSFRMPSRAVRFYLLIYLSIWNITIHWFYSINKIMLIKIWFIAFNIKISFFIVKGLYITLIFIHKRHSLEEVLYHVVQIVCILETLRNYNCFQTNFSFTFFVF